MTARHLDPTFRQRGIPEGRSASTVPDVTAFDHEDHHLRNVGRMVCDALQVLRAVADPHPVWDARRLVLHVVEAQALPSLLLR